ncbi:TadE/TadG family type IV pilus assembly protein [Streptomyces radicis]|uniref:Pilus assembly protein TadE n=1 Tax=Streptomyces radicis TaxID=1750517 RepID=A0A3A9WPZ9_9ACTN|nr:TadE/TadG family type IV pilus assembly protein [Streptomyces radicis]RKN11574.1 pilus assembly protein TadE [Streptomyces radicis]RKN26408.1 pilus assembly protein TadE [Streptomyces radicis]
MGDPRRFRRNGNDAGTATVELVLVTPLLVLLALLAVGFGRVTDARVRVEDAAHHAARAASLTHTTAQAEQAARSAAASALDASGASCASHAVALRHQRLAPGSTVTATVSCHSDLNDLLGTGLPGNVTLSAASTSPVDTYRSTP